jgi:hypothetical protein
MSTRQLEYLRKTHAPLIAKHNITQAHYDLMLGYLTEAMAGNGAEVRVLDSPVLQLLLEVAAVAAVLCAGLNTVAPLFHAGYCARSS